MDELFEVLTLVQTNSISKVPVILVGVEFWSGLREWNKAVMLDREHNINTSDLDLMPITDDPEEVLRLIGDFYDKKPSELGPNYSL